MEISSANSPNIDILAIAPLSFLLFKLLVHSLLLSNRNAMSLPGLDLTQPTPERQHAPAPPSQISLPKGSEWRFEVAFGTTVRVKVSSQGNPQSGHERS